ncbi:MAG TPA: FAD-dependent thymidylate synthase [Candidatus Saccharimonadales bacterium]|jgi:dTMP kinase|nr:FAD-dependent thymidylate synthase [Candidatus Saccharimonadales bacterium]
MATRRGAFIVIEGTDGSGKGTQFQLLRDRLVTAGYKVEAFDFPQYDQPSSYFVTQYLNGKYGKADEVGPYTASLFYALDRYESAARIRKAIDEGKIVISNRFTGSSMGHQGTKFANSEERRGYFIWLDNLEFEMLRIPRPDISFVLRVPVDITQQLIDQKDERGYTDKKRDIHESDHSHLERALAVYDDMTQLFPKDFQRIDCVRGGKLLDIETVQSMLWEKIVPMLPQPPQLEMPMPAAKVDDPAIAEAALVADGKDSKADDQAERTNTVALEPVIDDRPAITNPGGDVYAFTSKLEPAVVAAVMASLSRAGGELRAAVLDEFAEASAKDATVLQRSVRAYGEETAQEFVHQHVVVARASALLAAKLHDNRRATYISPEPRYLRYDQKDSNGMYRYHMPADLEGDTAILYRRHLDRIFDLYSAMLPRLSSYLQTATGVPIQARSNEWVTAMQAEARNILKAVLPVAATATVGIYASAHEFDTLLTKLQSDSLPEAQTTGQKLLVELRKTIPAYVNSVDSAAGGGSEAAYRAANRQALKSLADDFLLANHAGQSQAVQLVSVGPRNELDLVADMLYEHSNLPLRSIQQEVALWPYSRKLSVFEAYVGQRQHKRERPGRALEKIHYTWDITCDYSVFRELQGHRIVDAPAWQPLTPRFGYGVPAVIEAADLSDEFEECFDTSLALHSKLQQAGHLETAQYATLHGHKMRYTITYNAREAFHIHEQCTAPQVNAGVRSLVYELHEKLSEIHPLLGEAMQFVGQTENPQLN